MSKKKMKNLFESMDAEFGEELEEMTEETSEETPEEEQHASYTSV